MAEIATATNMASRDLICSDSLEDLSGISAPLSALPQEDDVNRRKRRLSDGRLEIKLCGA